MSSSSSSSDKDATPTPQPSRVVVDTDPSSEEVGVALPPSTPLEETESDILVQLARNSMKDSDERMEVDEEGAGPMLVEEGMKSEGAGPEVTEGEAKSEVVEEERTKEKPEGVEPNVVAEERMNPEGVEPEVVEEERKKEKLEGVESTDAMETVVDGDKAKREEGEEEMDPVVSASRLPLEVDARIGDLERTYGVLMIEKALGLLAAILPQDMTVSLVGPAIRCIYLSHAMTRPLLIAVAMDTAQTRY